MKLNMQLSCLIARSDSVTEAGDVIPAVWVEFMFTVGTSKQAPH